MDTDEAPRRFGREAVWVVAMTMLGAGLRLKGLGALGLDHFDEGIYAQAATWIFAEGGLRDLDPGLIPYAPPGFPVFVGLAYTVLGPTGTTAILVSILAGVLTIPVVSWLARRTFGRGAGGATAALAALAGPHVVFSRTALTDSTFLLFWSLAMVAGAAFIVRPGAWRAIRLGLLVGLAQLVKYNGWMAGAIVALSVLVGAIRPGDGRRSAGRAIGFGLIAASVSALVYLPWFVFVERTSGYAGLIAHHRSYIDGLAEWWPNWCRQMAQAEALEGEVELGVSWLGGGLALAWIGAAIGQGRSPRSWGRFRSLGPLIVLLAALASLAAPANLSWWGALAWSLLLLFDRRPSARLMATWFLVMTATTPFYHPYARLWLPTLAGSWVIAGGLVAALLDWSRGVSTEARPDRARAYRRFEPAAIAGLLALVLATIGPMLLPGTVRRFPDLLGRSDGIRDVVARLRPALGSPENPTRLVHLFSRPAFASYLVEQGIGPVRMHADFDSIAGLAPASGQVILIDAAQGVTAAEVATFDSRSPWDLDKVMIHPVSIPALLDVRPESIYDPDARHLGVDSVPETPPTYSGDDAGRTSIVWVFVAP